MAKQPNRLLRAVVPLLVILAGGGIFLRVLKNTSAPTKPAAPAPATTTPETASPAPTPVAQTPAKAPEAPGARPEPTTPAATTPPLPAAPIGETYTARTFPAVPYDPIGSTTPRDKGGTYEMEVRFSPVGSGVESLRLANYFQTARRVVPETIQDFRHPRVNADAAHPIASDDPRAGLDAFAAYRVFLNGQEVRLWKTPDPATTFWKQGDKPGRFEAAVVNESGVEIAKITRVFDLAPGTFDLTIRQTVENLRPDAALGVRWEQFGPVSPPVGTMRYGGDTRRVRFGYLLPASRDPERRVFADDRAASLILHSTAIGNKDGDKPGRAPPSWEPSKLWPSADSTKGDLTLAWAGLTNRYFTIAMYPLLPPGTKERSFAMASEVSRVAIPTAEPDADKTHADIALYLTSPTYTVAPGRTLDLSIGVYAGPTSSEVIAAHAPAAAAMGVAEVVMYTLGGPCSFCTFQFLTSPLHALLKGIHDYLTRDWALAIMLLVVCVRTLLHPITRWTQRKMFFFSKEMAKIAPKMKAIQERYKDEPAKLRQEQTRMMGEHGGVYASGALGCLPAFLQTPVWIALSAMLSFAFELRHSGAFFGVFQSISPGWTFLADMSAPDHLWAFGTSFHIPLLSMLLGPIDGLNALPLVLGVVFFIQQKYLTPPSATPLTPEQEQQQKMMRVMTVFMFPLMMYNAPAGLALYFATNSSLAIIESKLIRARAEEEWKTIEAVKAARLASGTPAVGAPWWDRKKIEGSRQKEGEGFLAKLRRTIEEAQKARDAAQKHKGKGKR
ncbi:MAG TPA: YidC/Oxa1 family insertase periplasmic-domain containing protein [Phycisphaerales bacterium]|nr:YidC/Oxa1 family insertase periplasmic-domain containing protein [Phycisphaerales bacterium]